MSRRSTIALASVGTSVAFVGLASLVLTDGFFAEFLLDRNSRALPYPFTIQNVMWIVFFVGAGELLERWLQTDGEQLQIHRKLLPEDEETLLRKQDLAPVFRRVKETRAEGDWFLQRLLARCILQFQVSGAIDKANNMFNSSLELFQHEIELKYNALRYVVWLIPTLGFIGTVVGIALALGDAGSVDDFQDPTLLKTLTQSLGVAFYTTLLALLQSAALMFALYAVQGREEATLNRLGQYCLDNLINRLFETD